MRYAREVLTRKMVHLRRLLHPLNRPELSHLLAQEKIYPAPSVPGTFLRAMSLLHPPAGFPVHLVPVWPWIWVQILVLRAAVRAAYGKGTLYHWSVTPWGRVILVSIDWPANQTSAPGWLKPTAHPNRRLAAALSGELLIPACAGGGARAAYALSSEATGRAPSLPARAEELPLPDS